MIIFGINPVIEALAAGRVTAVRVGTRSGGRVEEVIARARDAGVPVRRVEDERLAREAPGGAHQGVVADVAALPSWSMADMLRAAQAPALIVVLDGVEDPQNVGAIVRAADAAGVDGIVRQSRRAAPLGPAAVKASAGALAHARIVTVVNVARAVEELKGLGVWTVGLDGTAPLRYDQVDLALPTALVVGAEGSGLRRLVKERCDRLASIPMRGHVSSLNVAVATGIVLFEAVRQRTEPAGGAAGASRAAHGPD